MTLPQTGMTETVACPYCGSKSAVPVRSAADIVQCLQCGTVYLRTRLTDKALYQLYQNYAHEGSHMQLPTTQEEVEQSGLRRTAFVEEVLEFVEPAGLWLDIGCGWGAMLDQVRGRGFTPRGIELTRSCVDFAAMALGIPVSNSDFLESRVQQRSCAVISMVHVLEHLTHPAQSLRKVHASLIDGGLFCGIVPNFDSLCSELLQDGWAWLDPHYHYVHYTPKTLKARLEEAGFAIERLYTATGDYGEEIVLGYIQSVAPELPPSVSYADLLGAVEADGRGEEIRFFARKID
ncbi:MAG: methyltransferase domain-containing protein [Chlorobi bacterium]|nr:methyltransferase domain-containing protein [Chlorobiota bacterium]